MQIGGGRGPYRGMNKDVPELLEFPPKRPWWGADLQTLRQRLDKKLGTVVVPGRARALEIPAGDGTGDRLTGTLNQPETVAGRALIVLLHGVSGSEDSIYMHETARFFVLQGHPVLRLNLRGAGSSARSCSTTYHAGGGRDVGAVLHGLPGELLQHGVFLIGFSMGGSILLNGLIALGGDVRIVGAATVSAPLCLTRSARRLYRPRNRIYETALLRDLIRQEIRWRKGNGIAEVDDLQGIRRLQRFDDVVTAPRQGFRDAAEYYARSSSLPRLGGVQVPVLLVHAMDDPWISGAEYLELQRHPRPETNPALNLALTRSGGHVGFHFRGFASPWYNHRIGEFAKDLPGFA